MGQYSTQVVQPVHLSSMMYLGFFVRVTVKSPAFPFYTVDLSV
jgi:NADH:ubiquinone oxidoreductase subunit 4 (subunit M)